MGTKEIGTIKIRPIEKGTRDGNQTVRNQRQKPVTYDLRIETREMGTQDKGYKEI